MKLKVWRCAAIATAVFLASTVWTGHGALAQGCAGDMPSVCLQSFGAGSASISQQAAKAGCRTRLDTYRQCIAALAQDRNIGGETQLSRSERGFLSALEAELADNVGRLETFIEERMNLDGSKAIYDDQWLALRMRFFESTSNPSYFAAPADWLARAQGFYDDVARLLAREDVRHAYRRQATSVLYRRRVAREELEKLVAIGRRELLPEISAVLASQK